jgi:hypothetical protein
VVDGTPFERYRLVELLGRGGMGEVWRAYEPCAHDRPIALKVLPANFANDQVFQERFRREARATAGLDDPHVVPIHDSAPRPQPVASTDEASPFAPTSHRLQDAPPSPSTETRQWPPVEPASSPALSTPVTPTRTRWKRRKVLIPAALVTAILAATVRAISSGASGSHTASTSAIRRSAQTCRVLR